MFKKKETIILDRFRDRIGIRFKKLTIKITLEILIY